MNLEHKILSCNWNLRENGKKKTQPKFWGNSLLKKQLIGNLWSLPEFPYISKWPKVLFSERVWTDTKRDQARGALAEREPCFWHVPEFGFYPLQSNGDKCGTSWYTWTSSLLILTLLTSTKSAAEDYTSLLWSLTGRGDTSNRVEKHVKRIMHETASVGTIPTVFLNQCQVFWHFFLFLPLPPSHRSRR